jgi:hypothetical protein
MVEFGKTEDVGRRMGMLMTILSLGALAGPPLSGAINSATGGFEAVGYFAGMDHHAPLIMVLKADGGGNDFQDP